MILGPGTGLGVAALVEADGRFTAVSSEACHIDFGPISPEEYALWPHLERAHGRITSESVISGAGLARVHRARVMANGAPDPLQQYFDASAKFDRVNRKVHVLAPVVA